MEEIFWPATADAATVFILGATSSSEKEYRYGL